MFNLKTSRGFTLIELLIVIAIIGILSTLAVVVLSNARIKSRDSKRVSDLKQISTALELYYQDNNAYPTIITPGNSLVSPSGITYMTQIPSNPAPRNDGNCSDVDYSYQSSGANKDYNLSSCLGSGLGGLAAAPVFMSNSSVVSSCGNSKVIDSDGNQYDTVQIGTQCWMKQNLNVGTMILGSVNQANNNIIDKYCYDNDIDNCLAYGGLYQWAEAVQYLNGATNSVSWSPTPTGHIQGICPNGWHLPSDDEFKLLEMYLGLTQTQADATGYRGSGTTGTKLKLGGSSGFDALLGGRRSTAIIFDGVLFFGYYWQSTQFHASAGWSRSFYVTYSAYVDRSGALKATAYSVRCLKD